MGFRWLGGDSVRDRWHRESFDAAAWRSPQSRTNFVRIRMVDDLLRHHFLMGKTRQEVVAVLGEPDSGGHFRDWDLVYWLGPARGFIQIDSEWLVIRLNDSKRVSQLALVTD